MSDIRRAARDEGFALHPIKMRPPYLKAFGFTPDCVIDVGVHDGTPWLYRSFPDAHFVLVDPQAECEAAVKARVAPKSFDFRAVALGAAQGKAMLSVPETDPGKGGAMASLKERTEKLADTFTDVAKREVPVITLDMLAVNLPGRLGLKIDTEGFELEVLKGGCETLKRCDFVILEMSVTHRFKGVAPPSAIISELAKAGLEIRDVLALAAHAGKKAQPRHMDVLFTRWAE
ncbi:FkbM family methyltransferase [Litoreibacter janthinus]|uniref:Methyltransferase, FkbM family n=1 Tax=Litoreibacter janthinus TaxID=670154 RepID=A0A1I6GF75_9RHOB|nr:FkbM family methyltransferase [Litoreibacter janthinus]SFR40854.1 methyltransferase, FkbM family [Litoreibacter janthinus]